MKESTKIDLKGFADDVIQTFFDDQMLDGSDIEGLAVKHGLLEPCISTKPCCADCLCKIETGFPATCMRKTYVD